MISRSIENFKIQYVNCRYREFVFVVGSLGPCEQGISHKHRPFSNDRVSSSRHSAVPSARLQTFFFCFMYNLLVRATFVHPCLILCILVRGNREGIINSERSAWLSAPPKKGEDEGDDAAEDGKD